LAAEANGDVASAGDHVRLTAIIAQTRNLPEAQLAEAHELVVQEIVHSHPWNSA
jgi:hypothetical protein